MTEKLEDVLLMRPKPDEEMLEELEDVLISSDIGMDTTVNIIE
ncbi:MAG: signal recognition particle receptor subunit alpha, partial [Firmicutes bacterium]|nr:signal recognition particle receptor subunit alpha [Bacillota bacterium]